MLTATVHDLLTFPRQSCIHALELPPGLATKWKVYLTLSCDRKRQGSPAELVYCYMYTDRRRRLGGSLISHAAGGPCLLGVAVGRFY